MIWLLLPLAKLAFAGGVTQSNTTQTSKVKLPAKFLFNGQPLRSGPDNGFHVVFHAKQTDTASVLAKSTKGDWYYVSSTTGDGWTPKSALTVTGDVNSLPVWPNPFTYFIYKPEGKMDRPTDLKNGPDAGYETLTCIPANKDFKLVSLSQDKHWCFVWSSIGSGWVPVSAVNITAHGNWLPVLDTTPFRGAKYTPRATVKAAQLPLRSAPDATLVPFVSLKQNTELSIFARNQTGDWVYVFDEDGDGWAKASELNHTAQIQNLAIWNSPKVG